MRPDALFQVRNTVKIPGQWLEQGDIFDVFRQYGYEHLGYLLLVQDENQYRGCDLPFSCENVLAASKEEILRCIHDKYKENTFEIVNAYTVDLL